MSIAVDFYTGTYQEYIDQRGNYADNALYFCTDQQLMFKGGTLIGKIYQSVTSLNAEGYPNIQLPIEDILYLYDAENLIFAYEQNQWIKIFGNHICSIEHFNDTFSKVNWDGTARKLILPYSDNGSIKTVEINLGKDLILEDGSYYDEVNKKIRLKLAVPDADDSGENDGYIDIPVGDLVDIYEVGDTQSVNLTLTPTANSTEQAQSVNKYQITADVIVAPKPSNGKNNALQSTTTGLYVDVETYADARLVDAKNYTEGRLGTSSTRTVQSLLDEKVNSENGTLNNPTINNPTLKEAVESSPLDVKANDLWTDTAYDNRVVSVSMLKDFLITQNTWGAISRLATWGDLQKKESDYL